jgi:site-specific DNA-cytosine methylase
VIPAFDAFCGLGGWSTAAVRSGRVHVAHAINHAPHAIEAHAAAHPTTEHHLQDIAEFDFGSVGDAVRGGILFASPSCKGDSSAGRPARKGAGGNAPPNIAAMMRAHKGQRSLALHVIAAAEALQPAVVLVENVAGMRDGVLYPLWLEMLRALGYTVREHLLNAKYYGAATDRERLIVTAARGGPIDLAPSWEGAQGPRTVGGCLDDDSHAGNRWHSVASKPDRMQRLIRSRQERAGFRRGILNNVGDGVRLRPLSDPSPTLTTKSGSQLMLVDGDRVRILNPLELARMMGWQDDEVSLPANRGLAGQLVGNAIPVPLAQGVIAQAIEEVKP